MAVIRKGDYGQDLNFTVTESDGSTAVNLTSSTVLFKMARHRATENKIEKACTLVVAASGTCKYTLLIGDTDTAGTYKAELEITWAGPKVLTAKIETIKIVADLP